MLNSKISNFEKVKELSKGCRSVPEYLVRSKKDNKLYILKTIRSIGNLIDNEVKFMASINHPNVVGYKEFFYENKDLNVIMEYSDEGSLWAEIKKMIKEKKRFEENIIWSYSIQMIEGLKALHDKKIKLHDKEIKSKWLNSDDIFLFRDKSQCKIGMDLDYILRVKRFETIIISPYYTPPDDEPFSYKSDLWSIGCIIYELCNLTPPFKAKSISEYFRYIHKGQPKRISYRYSDDLWKMIQKLLEVDVKKRYDYDELMNSPFMQRKIKELKNENILLEKIKIKDDLDKKSDSPKKNKKTNYINKNIINIKNNKGSCDNKKIKFQKINNKNELEREFDKLKNDFQNSKDEIIILKNEIENLKNKNISLKNENQNLKIINENLKNENQQLKEENDSLKKLKNEIDNLKNNNLILKNELDAKNKNLNYNINELDNLRLDLNNKNKEIKNLNDQINNLAINDNLCDDNVKLSELMTIQFKSIDQKMDTSFLCKKTNKFIRLEEKLYNRYPEYMDYNTYFTVNGLVVKRFKTIEENNIKDSDKILLNIYE